MILVERHPGLAGLLRAEQHTSAPERHDTTEYALPIPPLMLGNLRERLGARDHSLLTLGAHTRDSQQGTASSNRRPSPSRRGSNDFQLNTASVEGAKSTLETAKARVARRSEAQDSTASARATSVNEAGAAEDGSSNTKLSSLLDGARKRPHSKQMREYLERMENLVTEIQQINGEGKKQRPKFSAVGASLASSASLSQTLRSSTTRCSPSTAAVPPDTKSTGPETGDGDLLVFETPRETVQEATTAIPASLSKEFLASPADWHLTPRRAQPRPAAHEETEEEKYAAPWLHLSPELALADKGVGGAASAGGGDQVPEGGAVPPAVALSEWPEHESPAESQPELRVNHSPSSPSGSRVWRLDSDVIGLAQLLPAGVSSNTSSPSNKTMLHDGTPAATPGVAGGRSEPPRQHSLAESTCMMASPLEPPSRSPDAGGAGCSPPLAASPLATAAAREKTQDQEAGCKERRLAFENMKKKLARQAPPSQQDDDLHPLEPVSQAPSIRMRANRRITRLTAPPDINLPPGTCKTALTAANNSVAPVYPNDADGDCDGRVQLLSPGRSPDRSPRVPEQVVIERILPVAVQTVQHFPHVAREPSAPPRGLELSEGPSMPEDLGVMGSPAKELPQQELPASPVRAHDGQAAWGKQAEIPGTPEDVLRKSESLASEDEMWSPEAFARGSVVLEPAGEGVGETATTTSRSFAGRPAAAGDKSGVGVATEPTEHTAGPSRWHAWNSEEGAGPVTGVQGRNVLDEAELDEEIRRQEVELSRLGMEGRGAAARYSRNKERNAELGVWGVGAGRPLHGGDERLDDEVTLDDKIRMQEMEVFGGEEELCPTSKGRELGNRQGWAKAVPNTAAVGPVGQDGCRGRKQPEAQAIGTQLKAEASGMRGTQHAETRGLSGAQQAGEEASSMRGTQHAETRGLSGAQQAGVEASSMRVEARNKGQVPFEMGNGQVTASFDVSTQQQTELYELSHRDGWQEAAQRRIEAWQEAAPCHMEDPQDAVPHNIEGREEAAPYASSRQPQPHSYEGSERAETEPYGSDRRQEAALYDKHRRQEAALIGAHAKHDGEAHSSRPPRASPFDAGVRPEAPYMQIRNQEAEAYELSKSAQRRAKQQGLPLGKDGQGSPPLKEIQRALSFHAWADEDPHAAPPARDYDHRIRDPPHSGPPEPPVHLYHVRQPQGPLVDSTDRFTEDEEEQQERGSLQRSPGNHSRSGKQVQSSMDKNAIMLAKAAAIIKEQQRQRERKEKAARHQTVRKPESPGEMSYEDVAALLRGAGALSTAGSQSGSPSASPGKYPLQQAMRDGAEEALRSAPQDGPQSTGDAAIACAASYDSFISNLKQQRAQSVTGSECEDFNVIGEGTFGHRDVAEPLDLDEELGYVQTHEEGCTTSSHPAPSEAISEYRLAAALARKKTELQAVHRQQKALQNIKASCPHAPAWPMEADRRRRIKLLKGMVRKRAAVTIQRAVRQFLHPSQAEQDFHGFHAMCYQALEHSSISHINPIHSPSMSISDQHHHTQYLPYHVAPPGDEFPASLGWSVTSQMLTQQPQPGPPYQHYAALPSYQHYANYAASISSLPQYSIQSEGGPLLGPIGDTPVPNPEASASMHFPDHPNQPLYPVPHGAEFHVAMEARREEGGSPPWSQQSQGALAGSSIVARSPRKASPILQAGWRGSPGALYRHVVETSQRSGLLPPPQHVFDQYCGTISAALNGWFVRRRLRSRRGKALLIEVRDLEQLMQREGGAGKDEPFVARLAVQTGQRKQQLVALLNDPTPPGPAATEKTGGEKGAQRGAGGSGDEDHLVPNPSRPPRVSAATARRRSLMAQQAAQESRVEDPEAVDGVATDAPPAWWEVAEKSGQDVKKGRSTAASTRRSSLDDHRRASKRDHVAAPSGSSGSVGARQIPEGGRAGHAKGYTSDDAEGSGREEGTQEANTQRTYLKRRSRNLPISRKADFSNVKAQVDCHFRPSVGQGEQSVTSIAKPPDRRRDRASKAAVAPVTKAKATYDQVKSRVYGHLNSPPRDRAQSGSDSSPNGSPSMDYHTEVGAAPRQPPGEPRAAMGPRPAPPEAPPTVSPDCYTPSSRPAVVQSNAISERPVMERAATSAELLRTPQSSNQSKH
ncbi:hypothetical protein CYMTET_8984 [Cymbomonas tetramitiformis]|uniref:Uncharacterized protein n=1 Tax=Cymbomonas tetramitiformis TaxID=36881 RepID=A0AAE0GRY4_9CHLO|nr:hypothetical protein CYMTET_8984 [Cymbomonas tetramitiformis]